MKILSPTDASSAGTGGPLVRGKAPARKGRTKPHAPTRCVKGGWIPVRIGALLFLCTLPSAGAVQPLDLVPERREVLYDGIKIGVLRFKLGDQLYDLTPPRNFEVSGDATELVFTPTFAKAAAIRIRNSTIQDFSMIEDDLDRYRALAALETPKEATDIQPPVETWNFMPVNGWDTFQIAREFNLYGVRRIHALFFWTLNSETQLEIRIQADRGDFERIREKFIETLMTWRMVVED